MKKIVCMLCTALFLNVSANCDSISLSEAIEILKSQNLEIKAATFEESAAKNKIQTVSGMKWGKLEFIQDIAKSNDAGNVFGFKLTSREATFNDFGFAEFGRIPMDEPIDGLNYPDARVFFQSKIKYELPIFTGFQITSYENIMKKMAYLKGLEKQKVVNEKIYELRKSFYDMALLEDSEKNLKVILKNITTLENMTNEMIIEGYAKKTDLLEVQAKKANVKRLISQMENNKKLLYHYLSFLLNKKISHIQLPQTHVTMCKSTDDEILNSNVDIQRAKTGLVIRKNMVDVSKSSFYPMVGAFAEIATADDTFLGDAKKHQAYTVGARLSWNIFNGGIDSAKVQEAKIEHLKTATQVELAKKGIALKIAKIRTEIEGYDDDIISLKKELDLTNEIYKNYELRYKEKLASMSDVIIKQSQQIEKILQLQQVQNKRNERVFALEKLSNGEYK